MLRLKKILLALSQRGKQLEDSLYPVESNQNMHKLLFSIVKGCLTVDEFEESELEIIRFSQRMKFPEELKSLQKKAGVKQSSLLYSFNPILRAGLIRMYGCLDNAAMPEESKHPILLARHIHEKAGNNKRNFMLTKLEILDSRCQGSHMKDLI